MRSFAVALDGIAPMNWTTPAELKAQLRRRWERGELLREDPAVQFPLRLVLKAPASAELASQFEAVRAWIAELREAAHVRIEWREVNHRIVGLQRVPQSIWVDDRESALAAIGKRAEASRYAALVETTRVRQPVLLPWLARRPLQALALAEEWERLLAVVDWIVRRPRPGVYLRQVDVPGVHSKFIEQYRAVLVEWLDLVLPPEAIGAQHPGIAHFAERYGFLSKPVRIRFRVLDPALTLIPGLVCPDVTLEAKSFAQLQLPIRRVIITENETNFLAFPNADAAIVVFGAGYGWEALSQARWLSQCAIYYWGDIDTHGFAILNRLRERFAHVESFLMDRLTLMAHETLWDKESEPVMHDLAHLTADERALYDELRDNRIRKGLRLEQERVGFDGVRAALARIVANE